MQRTRLQTVRGIAGPVLAVALTLAFLYAVAPTRAHAADLGGNCCSDLEERIAELEATTADKGNRKVSLEISGHLDQAWQYLTLDGYSNNKILTNGNDPSAIAISGYGRITPDLTAGYKLELDMRQLGILGAPISNNNVEVRQSYWWINHRGLGGIAVGKQGQATQDLDKWSTNSAWVAGKPLSFGSLSDAYFTGLDLPYDGAYRNLLRYDSPTWNGFVVSATWGPSFKDDFTKSDGNTWDVALRYSGEPVKDFKITGAAGYRHDTDLQVNLLGLASIAIPTGDVDTFLVNGSVLNVSSGIFVNANFADQDYKDADFTLRGLEVSAGLEQHWFKGVGATDVFGTWGKDRLAFAGSSNDLDYFGAGVVQAVDAAAMKLYLGWRHYQEGDILGSNVDVVTGGASIAF